MSTATEKNSAVKAGDALPEQSHGPVSRTVLALYAGASHDHNPMHIDIDVARGAGLPDVFAHGMLSMAYLAQLLTKWAPQCQLRDWRVRFTAVTPVNAEVRCGGDVVEVFRQGDEDLARLRIWAKANGELTTLEGEAVVALSP